mmetsp:Transcript_46978/g.149896  ORF Transcript_46978/g.149896 Transcript_46978/m.149896 type:complete len:239 (+) Transcript_46978:3-719(+)
MLGDAELRHADLVLTSSPSARHLFRARFRLVGSQLAARRYVLIAPRLKTMDNGNACYVDHALRVRCDGEGPQPEISPFGHFVVANVSGHMLSRLVVEHEYTNCRVRVQPRTAANPKEIVPVQDLSPEERANNLADDYQQVEQLRSLLSSQGLERGKGERDIAYAVRLGKALANGHGCASCKPAAHDLQAPLWRLLGLQRRLCVRIACVWDPCSYLSGLQVWQSSKTSLRFCSCAPRAS